MKPKPNQDEAHQITTWYFTKARSIWVAISKPHTGQIYTNRLISLTKNNLAIFTNMFIAQKHNDLNHLWDKFKVEVNRLSTLHIQTRHIKSRADLPWVTHEIRKGDKQFTQLKRTCSHKSHYTEKL